MEDRICALLRDGAAVFNASAEKSAPVEASRNLIAQAAGLAQRWPTLAASDKRIILQILIARIAVRPATVDIAIRPMTLAKLVEPHADLTKLTAAYIADLPTQFLSVPAIIRRTGMEMKLLIQGATGSKHREPDRSLLRLIGQARQFNDMFMNSRGKTIRELSREAGVSPSYFTRVFRLSFLAPEITKNILSPSRQSPCSVTISSKETGPGSASSWGSADPTHARPTCQPRRSEFGAVSICCGDGKSPCRNPAAVPPKTA